jgi:hypothetical protein
MPSRRVRLARASTPGRPSGAAWAGTSGASGPRRCVGTSTPAGSHTFGLSDCGRARRACGPWPASYAAPPGAADRSRPSNAATAAAIRSPFCGRRRARVRRAFRAMPGRSRATAKPGRGGDGGIPARSRAAPTTVSARRAASSLAKMLIEIDSFVAGSYRPPRSRISGRRPCENLAQRRCARETTSRAVVLRVRVQRLPLPLLRVEVEVAGKALVHARAFS